MQACLSRICKCKKEKDDMEKDCTDLKRITLKRIPRIRFPPSHFYFECIDQFLPENSKLIFNLDSLFLISSIVNPTFSSSHFHHFTSQWPPLSVIKFTPSLPNVHFSRYPSEVASLVFLVFQCLFQLFYS